MPATVDETSAGGLVVNAANEAAVIGRRSRNGRLLWVLPKGHIEPDETPEQTAVREVEEETGIRGLVRAELGVIDFYFQQGYLRIHKTVQHFLLDAVAGELSADDHEVAAVAWVGLDELESRLAFPAERRLVSRARILTQDG